MTLKDSMEWIGFQQTRLKRSPFGFSQDAGAILFDPSHPAFRNMDFRVVCTHELAHGIDWALVDSGKSKAFSEAIRKAKSVIMQDSGKYARYCKENDEDGFLSDIFSAITDGTIRFPALHEPDYWAMPEKKEKETFANLFSLVAFADEQKIAVLQKDFPDIIQAFMNLL